MEKSSSLLRTSYKDENNFRCSECDETFQKPLLATDSSSGRVQVYYACPRCLSKVGNVKEHKSGEEKAESPIVVGKTKKIEEYKAASCKHFLGYLRKRPKDSPIPDECLVCEKMIECLTR